MQTQTPSSKSESKLEYPIKTEKKPWPMSWVIIAILLYMLFQVSYLALKPIPHTVGFSYKYDRTLLKERQTKPKDLAP